MADIIPFRPRSKPKATESVRQQQTALQVEIEEVAHAVLDAADRLIAVLDQIEADPDLEDGSDSEPSLGAPDGHDNTIVWMRGGDRDLELDHQSETHP